MLIKITKFKKIIKKTLILSNLSNLPQNTLINLNQEAKAQDNPGKNKKNKLQTLMMIKKI